VMRFIRAGRYTINLDNIVYWTNDETSSMMIYFNFDEKNNNYLVLTDEERSEFFLNLDLLYAKESRL